MRRRLDAELVRRGLAPSRAEAAAAIRDGRVNVAGRPVVKASTLVGRDEHLQLSGDHRRFVSRGGEKLDAALERFGVDVAGRDCLDAGASTGGFTDCLLKRGAGRVLAVDVGYGQLAWELRQDPRVLVMERKNVRDLRPDDLPFSPEVVTADLAFISLRTAIGPLAQVAGPGADFVLLVKPQFEAGRSDVGKGGVVKDAEVWRRVLEDVVAASAQAGAGPIAAIVSPLAGPAGNVEFFLHARSGAAPGHLDLDAVVREAGGRR